MNKNLSKTQITEFEEKLFSLLHKSEFLEVELVDKWKMAMKIAAAYSANLISERIRLVCILKNIHNQAFKQIERSKDKDDLSTA